MLALIHEYTTRPKPKQLRFFIVGGPMGGKSTLLERLKSLYRGRAHFIDETATNFFTSGLSRPPRDPSRRAAWIRRFQQPILITQIMRELEILDELADSDVEAIFHDRGCSDSIVYLPDGDAEFNAIFGSLKIEQLRSHHDIVIHLESLATANPELFGKAGNEHRYESLAEAQTNEMATRAAWEKHPNYHFISGNGGIESVIARALAIIRPLLDVEIERRWVMPGMPECPLGDGRLILQGYFNPNDDVRLRREGERTTICGKLGSGLKRPEDEHEIAPWMFEAMWPSVKPRSLRKTRYDLVAPGGPYHLDVHLDRLRGYIRIERTFRNEDEAHAFALPDYFGNLLEVTDDPRHNARHLACHGLPVAA